MIEIVVRQENVWDPFQITQAADGVPSASPLEAKNAADLKTRLVAITEGLGRDETQRSTRIEALARVACNEALPDSVRELASAEFKKLAGPGAAPADFM